MKRVVVVGGGSAGLAAVRALRFAQVELTLVDQRNHHVFKPLLPQLAAGLVSETAAAVSFRSLLRDQRNVRFGLAEAVYLVPEQNRLILADRTLPYDFLIVATGSQADLAPCPGVSDAEKSRLAPGLQSVVDAVGLRNQLLSVLETAAQENEERQKELLRFLLVLEDTRRNPEAARRGIEHAAALVEMLRSCLATDFPEISPGIPRILICAKTPHIETGLPNRSWRAVERELRHAGIEFLTERAVTQLTPAQAPRMQATKVTFEAMHDGVPVVETLRVGSVLWHAAPQPGDFLTAALHAARIPADDEGWAVVQPDLSSGPFDNLFLTGSVVSADSFGRQAGREYMLAHHHSVAQGTHAAMAILARLRGEPTKTFKPTRRNPFLWTGRHHAHGALHPALGSLRLHGWPGWLGWLNREVVSAGVSPLHLLGPVIQTAIGGLHRMVPPALLHLRPIPIGTSASPAALEPEPQGAPTRAKRTPTTRSRTRGAAQ